MFHANLSSFMLTLRHVFNVVGVFVREFNVRVFQLIRQ